jgi:phage N-6-adenine-methyltransferase
MKSIPQDIEAVAKLAGPSMKRHQSKQDYATPPDFMEAVVRRFGPISWDLAAHAKNKKHASYFNEKQNSLKQDWHKIPGWLWLNPPFSNIAPWAEKCAQEAKLGAKILFLTPASVGSNWFAENVHPHALVLALQGRICFDVNNPTWGYPKDCMLSVFADTAGFEVWDWKS